LGATHAAPSRPLAPTDRRRQGPSRVLLPRSPSLPSAGCLAVRRCLVGPWTERHKHVVSRNIAVRICHVKPDARAGISACFCCICRALVRHDPFLPRTRSSGMREHARARSGRRSPVRCGTARARTADRSTPWISPAAGSLVCAGGLSEPRATDQPAACRDRTRGGPASLPALRILRGSGAAAPYGRRVERLVLCFLAVWCLALLAQGAASLSEVSRVFPLWPS
jgi:hypothetical protein